MRTVIFYRHVNGRSPIEDFLDSLNGKKVQKILWVLRLIEEMDRIPKQYFKKLVNSDDLWEVRVQSGHDIYRLLCFFDSGSVIVLTNGFPKKTQKIPRQESTLALQRREEYLARRK